AAPGRVVGVSDGARLHAERWVTPDGVAQFAGWYDTELAMPCDWASPNAWRCLPHFTATAFSDPACTIPAVRGPPGCTPPRFARRDLSTPTAYAVADPIATPYVYGITCMPATDGAIYYGLGMPLPDEMFVAGTDVMTMVGDALTMTEIVGLDGSRQFRELADAGTGESCDVLPTAAG